MLQGYLKLMRVELQTMLSYRAAFIIWAVGALLRSYFLFLFWVAVYRSRQIVGGIPISVMITYATLSTIQSNYFLYGSPRRWRLQERIREGNIVIDLLRPYHFLLAMFAGDLGEMLASVPLLGATLIFAFFMGAMHLPATFGAGIAYLLSLFLGFILNFLVTTIISLVAFWTFELSGIDWMSNLLISFLSGALIPLWFLPAFLQQLVGFLPFTGIVYFPVAIYVGEIKGQALWLSFVNQMFWSVVLILLALWIWKSAQHKLVVQGG